MADKILHKRSLTSGSIPTTSSLEIGELAINVNDGKLFLRQSGSIANKIITVGESASYALTASYVEGASSFPYTGSAQITGSLGVTGSVTATSFIGDGSGLTGIASTTRQSDYTSSLDPNINYLYLGEAPSGSSESSDVWDISRLSISSSGETLTQSTSSAAWTNRYTYTYL
jgi:hypothetical protein